MTIDEFIDVCKNDGALAGKFVEAAKTGNVMEFLQSQDVQCTEQDITNVISRATSSGALSDEQLEGVAGGFNVDKTISDLMKIIGIITGGEGR